MGLIGLAVILAAAAGFATQRGSICAVAATTQLVARGDARRYLALLACSLWSLVALSIAWLLGAHSFERFSTYSAGGAAALGGALFGAGAFANRACAFGSVARLGGGDLAFAATPVGFVFGAALLARIAPRPTGSPIDQILPESATPIAALFLGAFVVLSVFHAMRTVKNVKGALGAVMAKRWRPFFAMAVIGVVNAILAVTVAHWPYTSLLVDVASAGRSEEGWLKAILAIALVAGAAAGAATAGRFFLTPPDVGALMRKIPAGMMMGAGAYLIPGGNDALTLQGLPPLQPYAFVAYATMTATIAGLVFLMTKIGWK